MLTLPPLALLPLAFAAVHPQSDGETYNDLPLNNGREVALTFSDPSVGAAPGTPPDLAGDLFWKVVPGGLMHAPDGTLEITGFLEYIEEHDWSSPNSFYDRLIGPALESGVYPGSLEPAFFQSGLTSEVLVSIGPSGFVNPCTLYPSLITSCCGDCPCAPYGQGWFVEIQFDGVLGGIDVPADGTPASHLATTWFVPPGMTTTGGECGFGTYTVQAAYSTDETLATRRSSLVSPAPGGGVGSRTSPGAEAGRSPCRTPALRSPAHAV